MLERVNVAPADPIFGLTEAYKADTRRDKINLGAGIYKDESGQTPILKTVKKAEQILLDNECSKAYLPIAGRADYALETQKLIFGEVHRVIQENRAATVQAPGGTGALRILAEFAFKHVGIRTIWVSNPTWANHANIFRAAGLEVKEYRYYDANQHGLDFDGMLEDLSAISSNDMVLLHGCCHNPTGIDPTLPQWQSIKEIAVTKGWLPFFDFAYQGFGVRIEDDAQGLRLFAQEPLDLFVASSYSKNFGLYNERVGAATVIATTESVSLAAYSQLLTGIRANFSNPPSHGASIVATILEDPQLKQEWIVELDEMRNRIQMMRKAFVNQLKNYDSKQDFSFIEAQNGMFSFSGLNKEQIERLKSEFGIYIVGSGRISVAGMTQNNMDYLCKAIGAVL